MKRSGAICVIALGILAVGTTASAGPLLSAGSVWEYTFTDPTLDPSWNTTTGGWATGPAPFGNNTGGSYDPAGYFDWKTYWAADSSDGDDLWVRTSFSTTGFNANSIRWNLGVDNGFKLYLNGNLITQANGEGYTSRWEYSGDFNGFLNSGSNVIAVALEDHGGLTAFDMEVVGEHVAVPEPGTTLLLFAMGLAGVFARRKASPQVR